MNEGMSMRALGAFMGLVLLALIAAIVGQRQRTAKLTQQRRSWAMMHARQRTAWPSLIQAAKRTERAKWAHLMPGMSAPTRLPWAKASMRHQRRSRWARV